MIFEIWLKNRGFKIEDLTRKEGRKLYRQFGQEMTPAIRDYANFLNAAFGTFKHDKAE